MVIDANLKFTSPLIPLDPKKVKTIYLHHIAAEKATIEQIHQWHIQNGWNGCGYNEYIKKDGTVFIGRGDNIGAHVAGHNSQSYGIAVEGDFDKADILTDDLAEIIVGRIKKAQERFLFAENVLPHKAHAQTSCPGKNFDMNKIYNKMAKNEKVITTIDEAIRVLVEIELIKSPDYWIKATKVVKYLDDLLINIANHIVRS